MIKIRILCFILISTLISSANLFAQRDRGCAILFDNSGSMTQYFRSEQLKDAKNLIKDLMFRGTFDKNKWEVSGNTQSIKKIWQPNTFLYVHPFGSLNSRTEPFFSTLPEYDTKASENDAIRFIDKYLLKKLRFNESFTYIDLAKKFSWWKISNLLGQKGKSYFMDVMIVTDGQPDQNAHYAGSGLVVERSFTSNNVREVPLLLFIHRTPSYSNPNVNLKIHLFEIGPHFIRPVSPPPAGIGNTINEQRIKLIKPNPNEEIHEEAKRINFVWESKGNFEKYILEVSLVNPRKKIIEKVFNDPKARRFSLSMSQVQQKLKNVNPEKLKFACFVKGVFPEESESVPITSGTTYFNISDSTPWGTIIFFTLLILLLILLTYLYQNGKLEVIIEKIKERLNGLTNKQPVNNETKSGDRSW